MIYLSDRELAAILVALRTLPTNGNRDSLAVANHLFANQPLSPAEIDALCHRLKARPAIVRREGDFVCDCELEGEFHSGIPGILAYVHDGKLDRGSVVERCDLCERYPSDEAARARLIELGIAPMSPES